MSSTLASMPASANTAWADSSTRSWLRTASERRARLEDAATSALPGVRGLAERPGRADLLGDARVLGVLAVGLGDEHRRHGGDGGPPRAEQERVADPGVARRAPGDDAPRQQRAADLRAQRRAD